MAVNGYVYHDVDYCDDPDVVLPERERFNDEFGKKDNFIVFFVFLMFL
jgi:hypothetical protein